MLKRNRNQALILPLKLLPFNYTLYMCKRKSKYSQMNSECLPKYSTYVVLASKQYITYAPLLTSEAKPNTAKLAPLALSLRCICHC